MKCLRHAGVSQDDEDETAGGVTSVGSSLRSRCTGSHGGNRSICLDSGGLITRNELTPGPGRMSVWWHGGGRVVHFRCTAAQAWWRDTDEIASTLAERRRQIETTTTENRRQIACHVVRRLNVGRREKVIVLRCKKRLNNRTPVTNTLYGFVDR